MDNKNNDFSNFPIIIIYCESIRLRITYSINSERISQNKIFHLWFQSPWELLKVYSKALHHVNLYILGVLYQASDLLCPASFAKICYVNNHWHKTYGATSQSLNMSKKLCIKIRIAFWSLSKKLFIIYHFDLCLNKKIKWKCWCGNTREGFNKKKLPNC